MPIEEMIQNLSNLIATRGAQSAQRQGELQRSQLSEAAARFGLGGVPQGQAVGIERGIADATIQAQQQGQLFGARSRLGHAQEVDRFRRQVEERKRQEARELMLMRQRQQFASQLADRQRRSQLIGSLAGVGGTILGGPLGGAIAGGIGNMFSGGGAQTSPLAGSVPGLTALGAQ